MQPVFNWNNCADLRAAYAAADVGGAGAMFCRGSRIAASKATLVYAAGQIVDGGVRGDRWDGRAPANASGAVGVATVVSCSTTPIAVRHHLVALHTRQRRTHGARESNARVTSSAGSGNGQAAGRALEQSCCDGLMPLEGTCDTWKARHVHVLQAANSRNGRRPCHSCRRRSRRRVGNGW